MTKHKHKAEAEHYSSAPEGGRATETCKCGAVQRYEMHGKTRVSTGWKTAEELAEELAAPRPAQKSDRVHLYYPDEDQTILQQALKLSPFSSASSLVRELVRRYHRQLLKKAVEECDR